MAEEKEALKSVGLKTARSSVLYLVVEVVTSFISLIILLFLARTLKPAEFGFYAIAIAFSQLLSMAGNFGMGVTLMKKIPESTDKGKTSRLLMNGYYVSCIAALVLSAAGFIGAGYISLHIYGNEALTLPIEIAAAAVFLYTTLNTTNAGLLGSRKVKEAAAVNIAYTLTQLVVVVVLVSLGFGIAGAMTGYFTSLLMGCVLGIVLLFKEGLIKIRKLERKLASELYNFSIPILLSNLVSFGINNLSVLVLGIFALPVIVGNYGAAVDIGTFITPVVTSLTYMLLPAFSYLLSQKRGVKEMENAFGSSVYYTMLFFFPLIAYIAAAANPIMALLLSRSYAYAGGYFALIAIGMCIGIIGTYAGTMIIGFGETRTYMACQVAVGVTEIILLFALVPYLKAIGAIISVFIIGTILSSVIFVTLLKRKLKIRFNPMPIIRMAAAAVVVALIMAAVTIAMHQSEWSLIADAVIALVLYPPLAIAFRGVRKKEIKFMKETATDLHYIRVVADPIFNYAEYFTRFQKRLRY